MKRCGKSGLFFGFFVIGRRNVVSGQETPFPKKIVNLSHKWEKVMFGKGNNIGEVVPEKIQKFV